MNDVEIRCPSCRAPQNAAAPGAEVRCVFCKHVYRVPGPSPVVAPTAPVAPAPAAPSGMGRGLLVMALGATVVASSVGAFVWFSSASPPPPSSSTGFSGAISVPVANTGSPSLPVTPVAVQAEAEAEPKVELVHVVEGATSIGGKFYLVDLKNVGTAEIGQPAVIASGFDAQDHRILEQNGYSRRGTLGPGETATILVLISEPPAGLVRVDVTPRPTGAGYATRNRPAEVVESSERPSYGTMHEMVGTVRNGTDTRLAFIQVVAVGRDASGKPVSYADGFATTHTLDTGASSGFSLSLGTFEVSRPATWELVAFGQ